jgi:cyclic beta-1,2-glucan synthetase
MGSGDWNDGMNRVGIKGEGESVWLGWFLYDTLIRAAWVCDRIGDGEQAAHYREQAKKLQDALENNAWDGDWYLRAYYDDGTPLGSAEGEECQIDAIAQSWAILSKGSRHPERVARAMEAVSSRLIDPEGQLIRLFTPPFDKTLQDPGYIKGYPPGIRENGGQYTHAALWTVWAFAALGDGDRAVELFELLNPITHTDTPEKAAHYRVEPYVVAADVYSEPPHIGRGGWTWYTGSAGWMYRLGIEAILGLKLTGETFTLEPCIPRSWEHYEMTYRHDGSTYHIHVENPQGVSQGVVEVTLDGQPLLEKAIPWLKGGQEHRVQVIMGHEAGK